MSIQFNKYKDKNPFISGIRENLFKRQIFKNKFYFRSHILSMFRGKVVDNFVLKKDIVTFDS